MQARLSSLLAFLTDLWKLKEEALAKQGKSEVILIMKSVVIMMVITNKGKPEVIKTFS